MKIEEGWFSGVDRDGLQAFGDHAVIIRRVSGRAGSVEKVANVFTEGIFQGVPIVISGQNEIDLIALIEKQIVKLETLRDNASPIFRSHCAENSTSGVRASGEREVYPFEAA